MIQKRIENDTSMLVEYKGDKQPIGKFTSENDFTQTTIQCNEGDHIYLITDGFPDQFGGPDGRKFMYRPFKQLLLSLEALPIDKQLEKLKESFTEWKGNEMQIDDICIIGIKF